MSEGRQTATTGIEGEGRGRPKDPARKRAAAAIVARHEAALKRTARRYSLNVEDAEDAYQRALEIVLTKAPTTDLHELIRWTQTVTKHEALAVRQSRERLLGYRAGGERDRGDPDPIAQIPVVADGPDELVARREAIARSREALRALKPAELRALTLLAEGYSYAEIGEITGFSATKVNRLLAEGRERFRGVLSSSEDGRRCRELRPLLSAFCDGEASPAGSDVVREHLRACGRCRATMRAYRAAPRVALGLAPALLPARSLLERVRDLLAELGSRLPGAAGTKLAVGCVAVAGSAGLATGVVPEPTPESHPPASHARPLPPPVRQETKAAERVPSRQRPEVDPPPVEEEGPPIEAAPPAEAVEYEAPPAAAPAPPPVTESAPSPPSGSAAGEFGP